MLFLIEQDEDVSFLPLRKILTNNKLKAINKSIKRATKISEKVYFIALNPFWSP
jgi:hypothetical protein